MYTLILVYNLQLTRDNRMSLSGLMFNTVVLFFSLASKGLRFESLPSPHLSHSLSDRGGTNADLATSSLQLSLCPTRNNIILFIRHDFVKAKNV
jgi:hypothetical protein